QRLTMKAFDAAGNTVDGLTGHANNAVQTLRLQGEGITLVQIDSRAVQMPTLLLRLCYESQPQSDEEEGTSNDDVTCMRALQLPAIRQPARGNVPIEGEIEAYIKERLGQRWVTFHTGEIVSGFFLLAVSREVLERLMVAELESDGSVI